jgi:hypothetical protein
MARMLDMLRDLVAHKGHANAAVLNAIRQNAAAVCCIQIGEQFLVWRGLRALAQRQKQPPAKQVSRVNRIDR